MENIDNKIDSFFSTAGAGIKKAHSRERTNLINGNDDFSGFVGLLKELKPLYDQMNAENAGKPFEEQKYAPEDVHSIFVDYLYEKTRNHLRAESVKSRIKGLLESRFNGIIRKTKVGEYFKIDENKVFEDVTAKRLSAHTNNIKELRDLFLLHKKDPFEEEGKINMRGAELDLYSYYAKLLNNERRIEKNGFKLPTKLTDEDGKIVLEMIQTYYSGLCKLPDEVLAHVGVVPEHLFYGLNNGFGNLVEKHGKQEEFGNIKNRFEKYQSFVKENVYNVNDKLQEKVEELTEEFAKEVAFESDKADGCKKNLIEAIDNYLSHTHDNMKLLEEEEGFSKKYLAGVNRKVEELVYKHKHPDSISEENVNYRAADVKKNVRDIVEEYKRSSLNDKIDTM